jgi:DNA-binding transcriptional regulator YhcF (GntR family)
MKKSGIPGGVQSAVDFICTGIETGLFAVGEYLPVIPRLSTMAGVSSVTMSKAQVILKGRKILSGHSGQRTRVAGKPPARALEDDGDDLPEPLAREEAHVRICRQMREGILDGVYGPGSLLPLVQQLMSRYRAAAITIRKAIMLLCEEGLVVPQRRHYAVARLSTADSGERIGVLIDQYAIDKYNLGAVAADTVENYFREIELQAAAIPIGTALAVYEWQADQLAVKEPCSILPHGAGERSDAAGYILAASFPAVDFRGLCARLARSKKPVSVLDFDGGWMPPSPCSQPYAVFPVGVSATPGKKVANYLLSLGHHHVAFFSAFHKSLWSRTRYQGMLDTYAEAGYPGWPQLFGRSQDDWQVDVNTPPLPGLADVSQIPAAYDVVKNRIQMGICLQPLFEQAIANSAITAWVAANDGIAVCAQEFLQARGIKVPGQISLVSFDDTVASMARRITSYNFNLPAIVIAAFRHILQSKPRSEAPRPRTVEIPGAIVERETTGRAPRKTA